MGSLYPPFCPARLHTYSLWPLFTSYTMNIRHYEFLISLYCQVPSHPFAWSIRTVVSSIPFVIVYPVRPSPWCVLFSFHTEAAAPIAKHFTVTAVAGEDVTINLLTYDADDDADQLYTITALPVQGAIYAPSNNWMKYGYAPIKGSQITTVPHTLTISTLVYAAPVDFSTDQIQFKVTSVDNEESSAGFIDVTDAGRVYQESVFNVDEEDWQVVAASSVDAPWSATSTALLNHYIYAGEIDRVLGQNNNVRWYFEAPVAFHGDHPNLVGGACA